MHGTRSDRLRWVDAFPWLESDYAPQQCENAGLDPTGPLTLSAAGRPQRLAVRDISLKLLNEGGTFVEVFPNVPGHVGIGNLQLRRSTARALQRHGLRVVANLGRLGSSDISKIWTLRLGGLQDLASGLTIASIEAVLGQHGASDGSRKVAKPGHGHAAAPDPQTETDSDRESGRSVSATDSVAIADHEWADVVGPLAVRRSKSLKGRVAVEARYRIPDVAVSGDVVLARLPLVVARKALRLPPKRKVVIAPETHVRPAGAAVVRAQGSWFLDGNELGIVKAAPVISGGPYVEAALSAEAESVVCVALFSDPSDGDTAYLGTPDANGPAQVGSNTERLAITMRAVVVTLASEPFVIATRRGYSAAVLVRRRDLPREHLLVSAASLSGPLERIRERRGMLTGAVIEVCKESNERSAKYVVRERSGRL